METFKETVNQLSSPVTIFFLAVAMLLIFVTFPRQTTSLWVSVPLLIGAVAFFVVGLRDEHFRSIVAAPDNVPIVALVFIAGFFSWYAMRKAVENDRRMEMGLPTIEKLETDDKVLVFPYLIFIEFVVALVYAIGLVVWSILLKAPLEEPANPTVSPNPSKAPWYFLGLQESLVYFDPWIAGVLFPTFIILGLCAIPYIDRSPQPAGFYCYKPRRRVIATYLFGFWILWILLIVYGTFLRGPNWNFFGPFETWDVHKVVPLVNVNLSEFIFIKGLGVGLPKQWFIREAPGILLVALYYLVPPPILAQTWFKRIYQRLEPVRYSILMILLLSMLSLPIKMILRWAFNLKYIVAIPEYFFNI
jgi:hypothetical protein